MQNRRRLDLQFMKLNFDFFTKYVNPNLSNSLLLDFFENCVISFRIIYFAISSFLFKIAFFKYRWYFQVYFYISS